MSRFPSDHSQHNKQSIPISISLSISSQFTSYPSPVHHIPYTIYHIHSPFILQILNIPIRSTNKHPLLSSSPISQPSFPPLPSGDCQRNLQSYNNKPAPSHHWDTYPPPSSDPQAYLHTSHHISHRSMQQGQEPRMRGVHFSPCKNLSA